MRRVMKALVGGSLVFGLVAAAASAATFGLTLEDVIRIGWFEETAEVVVVWQRCEGDYQIAWTIDGQDVLGFVATRSASDPDETLGFCAEQPFALFVSSFLPDEDEDAWTQMVNVPTIETETDERGDIAATFVEPFEPGERDEVTLLVGPEAARSLTP